MTSTRPPLLRWLRPVPAHSAWLAMLAVAGAFSVFASAQALWSTHRPAHADLALANTETADEGAPRRLRCQTCGVVEAIDHRESGLGLNAAWVFSVRLPDGSLRHSPDALRGEWQVGDGMQLIGGERTWNQR